MFLFFFFRLERRENGESKLFRYLSALPRTGRTPFHGIRSEQADSPLEDCRVREGGKEKER